MCLAKLDYVNRLPETCFGIGYKVCLNHGNHIYESLFVGNNAPMREGMWFDEKAFRYPVLQKTPDLYHCVDDRGSPYPLGFHIYTRYEDALAICGRPGRLAILLVNYTGVVATGVEVDAPVVVAKEMKILAEL